MLNRKKSLTSFNEDQEINSYPMSPSVFCEEGIVGVSGPQDKIYEYQT